MLLRRFLLVLLVMGVTGGLAHAQGRTVSGKVQEDVTQEPIPGATVTVKDTELGAITDVDGSFIIENAPPGPVTLHISGVSYQAREVVLAPDQQQVTVTLALGGAEESAWCAA